MFLVSENYGDFILTNDFGDYVKDMGFEVRFCHKYDPESKAKVESVVPTVKSQFLKGRVYCGNRQPALNTTFFIQTGDNEYSGSLIILLQEANNFVLKNSKKAWMK